MTPNAYPFPLPIPFPGIARIGSDDEVALSDRRIQPYLFKEPAWPRS